MFIEADQEIGLCMCRRGWWAGRALIPCPPLTLPFGATGTQLEMSMWAILPFDQGKRMTLIKCFVVVLAETVAEEVFMSSFGHVVQVRPDGDDGVLTATHSEEPWVRACTNGITACLSFKQTRFNAIRLLSAGSCCSSLHGWMHLHGLD